MCWRIFVLVVTPRASAATTAAHIRHTLYMDIMVPQFAMPTMSGALAAEVRGLPISSRDFGGPWDDMFFSSLPLPNLFQKRFLHLI